MNTFTVILKIVILSLVLLGALSLFWPFVIPGMLLCWIFRERHPGWIGPAVALLVVLILRLSMGEWQMRIGGQSSGEWYVELMLGIVSWAVGSILVTVGYKIPSYFLGGFRMKDEARANLNS